MVVEAAELLDSCSLPLLGLGVVKDWLSRRVGAVARVVLERGERAAVLAVVCWRRCGDVVLVCWAHDDDNYWIGPAHLIWLVGRRPYSISFDY
ncbi:hypothetical protein NC653_003796 [Populus alba x Populus x berolinensis]|uniref:Uncharacterized protein n=1 Tax=Populus alba x Populus x berolinensis TaxID=444605 RepID=A0AAD6RSP6_9ROSI|nr:hypothetical protein NC653_003796 [Populus alba x Populus x berolinensis]